MPNNYQKRIAGPLLAVLSVVTAGTLLSGCGSGDAAADSPNSGPSSSSSSSGTSNSGVAYAQCMRKNGVTNFPDPEEQSGGGVKLVIPEGVDQNSPTFKSAQSACQSLLYQGDTGDAAGSRDFDATKVAAWAKCIRENGVPNFPDPEVNGNTIVIDVNKAGLTGRDDPNFTKAAEACYSIRPGGTLAFMGGPQQ